MHSSIGNVTKVLSWCYTTFHLVVLQSSKKCQIANTLLRLCANYQVSYCISIGHGIILLCNATAIKMLSVMRSDKQSYSWSCNIDAYSEQRSLVCCPSDASCLSNQRRILKVGLLSSQIFRWIEHS